MSTETEICNPNENISIPDWINASYFRNILIKDEQDFVAVKNFKPIAAIPPGENYTSVMLRVHMDLFLRDQTTKHKTYILKIMLDDDKGGDVIQKLDLFPKEMKMYNKYLPAFEELYSSVGWSIRFAPKCLFIEQKEDRINFVFEDLSSKKFKNLNRLQGCDMNHMKSVLRKLAEFHAASAVYEERNGPYPKEFQVGFVDPEFGGKFQREMFNAKEGAFKKAMQMWHLEDADKYLEKFPTVDQYWKCCLSTLKQKSNHFNVLTHGDFWSNNIMFSYLNDNVLNDLIFLDFQICKWGSPAEDLLFFITVSAAKDIRITKFDHLISIYHERLVDCLRVLGFRKSLPKLRDLHKDLFDQKNTFYAFFACFNHLAGVLLPADKDASIHSFSRLDEVGEKFRMKTFTNPLFVEAMKDIFPFYHARGLFNFTDYDDD